jgi:CBS domain-containing protein
MAREIIGSVMLTDPIGRLAGIVSERNLVPALARNGAAMPNITAQQPMTNGVVACLPEVGIEIALGLMSTNQIRHLPVVNDGQLLSLISIREILIADIERRRQEADDLWQAHERLEELI